MNYHQNGSISMFTMICDDNQTDYIGFSGQDTGPNNVQIYNFEIRSKYFCFTKPQDCLFLSKNKRFDLSRLRSDYETWTAYDTRAGMCE